MGPFKRLTKRRPEQVSEVDPRLQAHPMAAEPEAAEPEAAKPEALPEAPAADRPEPSVPRAPVPVMATHTSTAEEQPYDRLDCPACGTIFNDLPDLTAVCPSCGASVQVLTCPEGVRHLLTASDVAAFDDDWDALHAQRRREEAQRRNAVALQARRATLASYAELGVRLVELRTASGACVACLSAAGRPYRPRTAPGLPIAGCENAICRCLYAPARPSPSRR